MNTSPVAAVAAQDNENKKQAIIAITKIVVTKIVLPVAIVTAAVVIAKKLDKNSE